MNENFLLTTELSGRLYKDWAANLPIIDFHNHLSIMDMKKKRRFVNLYELWIEPDPYKHRAMRMCGVSEFYITGQASEKEKFRAWCEIFPQLVGNPLYQWSLSELKEVLGLEEIPCSSNWKEIWDYSVAYMERNEISISTVLGKYKVECICPCMTLMEDVEVFQKDNMTVSSRVIPSLRGDDIVCPTSVVLHQLEKITGIKIDSLEAYKEAISVRLNLFEAAGCRFADHAIDHGFQYRENDGKNEDRFQQILLGKDCREEDRACLTSFILAFLGSEYERRNMVMQLHLGAQRFTSTRLRQLAGIAGGYACIGNFDVDSLTRLLDEIERMRGGLPRIILYALNPSDYAILASLSGSYSRDGKAGLITLGPAWWWCDHCYGIRSVLEKTASYGLLTNFVGMTTDSRSIMSFARHDYFRRVLCDWLAKCVQEQELPKASEILRELIYQLCYGNAKEILEKG